MRQSRDELKKDARPNRVPVYEANRNRLTVKGLDQENFHYRWVNDRDDRLATFLAGGYEFAEGKVEVGDGGVDQSAGTSSKITKGVGGGAVAYLMRIPKDLWLEDQKAKEDTIKKTEADMKKEAQREFYGRVDTTNTVKSNPF